MSRTKRSRRRQRTQKVIARRMKLLRHLDVNTDNFFKGNRLSKFTLSCTCKTCRNARVAIKKEEKEFREKVDGLRLKDSLEDWFDEARSSWPINGNEKCRMIMYLIYIFLHFLIDFLKIFMYNS